MVTTLPAALDASATLLLRSGAPQRVYTDQFLHTQPLDGPIVFKLEAAPLHPVIFASTVSGFGQPQADLLRQFPHTQVLPAPARCCRCMKWPSPTPAGSRPAAHWRRCQ